MKVELLGKKKVQFTNDNGELVIGINLFYCGKNPDVEGLVCDKKWIPEGNALYSMVVGLDLSEPIPDCELEYDIVTGSKKPILTNIIV